MRNFCHAVAVCLGCLGGAVGGLADEIDPLVKASSYGDKTVWSYHDKAPVPWSLFKPKDFGATTVAFDGTGVRPIGRVPAGGIHPRIFFSPEDLPEIRRRIRDDQGAREAWKNLLCYANAMKLTYDEKADYAQPDWMNGGFGVHGRVPVFRVGGYGRGRENYYALLAAGKKPEKTYEKTPPAEFFKVASVEALRCLIDDDAEAGRTLAAAVATAVKLEQERRARDDKPVEAGQPPKPSTPRLACANLGLVYDFLFNFMSPEQRRLVHDELVTISAWSDNYGTFNDAEASRSNWACFNYWVWDLLALHGEEGFNDLKFLGLYRGWRNFYTASFFDSGAAFEGEGKLLFGLDAALAMDRIAPEFGLEPLTWHPLPRRYFSTFLPGSMLPTRGTYAVFDILGGMGEGLTTPADVVMAKYLYPDDPTIDFVYRGHVGDDYRNLPASLHHIVNEVVTTALFATAYGPEKQPDAMRLPLTFFCGQRALLMTRSSWDKDATMLTMHVRGASGGHPYRDRNGIMLAGAGRTWATIPRKDIGGWAMNTVLVDGGEQTAGTPGRVVDFSDGPQATFVTGDAKYGWDWVWGSVDRTPDGKPVTSADVRQGNVAVGASWKLVEQSFNDFAWTKVRQPVYDRPLKESPHWVAMRGNLSPVTRQVNSPVLEAFRTAGLVRGARPYVIVIDDIQRDAFPALYDWNLTLPADVIEARRPTEAGMEGDVLLSGTASLDPDGGVKPGEPLLLVRVVHCAGDRLPISVGKRNDTNLLSIATRAAAPGFKVLLHACRAGQPLPKTAWDAARQTVSIDFPGQRDTVRFTRRDSGKTDVIVERGSETLASVVRPVEPLADPETDRLTARLRELPARLEGLQPQDVDAKQLEFVGGWRFDEATTGPIKPLAGSMAALQPLVPGPLDRIVDGPAGRKALAIGSTALVVPLPPGDPKGALPFSIAAWVKTKPNAFMGRLFEVDGAASLSLVQGTLRLSGPRNWIFDSWASSMLSSWTHVALTYDGKEIHTFRNGLPLATISAAGHPLRIGGNLKMGGNDPYGDAECAIGGISFYAQALSPAAVQSLYIQDRYGTERTTR